MSTRSPSSRSRTRMLAATVAAVLVAPLAVATVAPAYAYGSTTAPIAAGAPSSVSVNVGGTSVDVTYSEVLVDGVVDVDFGQHNAEAYSAVPENHTGVAYLRSILRDGVDGEQQVIPSLQSTICVDLAALGTVDTLNAWQLRWSDEAWLSTPSTATGSTTRCYESAEADTLLLFTREIVAEEPPVDPPVDPPAEPPLDVNVDVQYSTVPYFTFDDNPFFFGPTKGTYLSVDLTNSGSLAVTVGLGADMLVEGETLKLWLPESTGSNPEDAESLRTFFTRTIEPGQTITESLPDFPGMTYTVWAIADDGGAGADLLVNTHKAEGLFVPFLLDVVTNAVGLGVEAVFAGTNVFPGATTTVQAEGLNPGEQYELWLTPGADYFSFMFTGAVLDAAAVNVGSATVDSSGRLATAFTVPVSAPLNSSYQLMIGAPSTRSWPAGTYAPIRIVAPEFGDTIIGPTAVDPVVSIPLGESTVSFSFPTVTGDGETTASGSDTGPAAVGFTLAGSYYHLSTTATFSGNVEVCISVADGDVAADLKLYHYVLTASGYEWVDITTRYTDTAVCGETDSFSPFALGIPDEPVDVVLTSKDECKQGGWETSTLPIFYNQGNCVSYIESQKPYGFV